MKCCLALVLLSVPVLASSPAFHEGHGDHGDVTRRAVELAHEFRDRSPRAPQVLVHDLADPARVTVDFFPLLAREDRSGVQLGSMSLRQRRATDALLQTVLSQEGYLRVHAIRSLEDVLRAIEVAGGSRLSDSYTVRLFGDPSGDAPWGLKFEGHHLSINATLAGDSFRGTPLFLGSNPGEVKNGPYAGLRVLAPQEDLGRMLLASLTEEQLGHAVQSSRGQAIPRGALRTLGAPAGLPAEQMSEEQRALLVRAITSYAANLRPSFAAEELERIEAAGVEALHFLWRGGTEPGDAFSYLIEGPTVAIQFDALEDPGGGAPNHFHCLWRDPERDFGEDLLARHYAEEHGDTEDQVAGDPDGAPRLGYWDLAGRGGRDWEATLVLEHRNGDRYSGRIHWTATSGAPAGGTERVEGSFDARLGILRLSGQDLSKARGNIVVSEYEARVSPDGRRLAEGVWGGPNVAPGVWSASWTRPLAGAGGVASTPHFTFFSHELLNLHHFLYQSAKALARRDGEHFRGRPVEVAELDELEGLEGSERDAWFDAIAFYREELVERDLLFDGRLYAVKRSLASIDDSDAEWPDDLDAGVAAALRTALPVYRARYWPSHDARNRDWIAAARGLLDRYGPKLVERMTSAFGGSWPEPSVRVDVSVYANWAGAYTTGRPTHVTLASSDPNSADYGALEVLVHEASHTDTMIGALRPAFIAPFLARDAEPPRDLWHLFIFATAGEVVRRTLAEDGIEGYAHYGDRTGLYERGPWREQSPIVREIWSQFLAGTLERAAALTQIAEELD